MEARRPLKTRQQRWAQHLTRWLATRTSITPNQISVLSVAFASMGATALALSSPSQAWLLLIAAVGVQLRLLANMLDGMVAVEHGKATISGVLYNEIPDRIADLVLFIALGIALEQPFWGCVVALLACLTAYIRVLGGSLGLPQSFRGPMAKQHRMFALTLGVLAQAIEWQWWSSNQSLLFTVAIIGLGSVLTCLLRTHDIAVELERRSQRPPTNRETPV